MGKLIYIYISVSLFIASFYVSIFSNNKYLDTLNEKEKNLREKVVKERSIIFSIASLSALFIVFLLFVYKKNLGSRNSTVWMYVSIYFVIEYFVYSLLPKKHWMLHSVENKQDALDWLEKYKYMKKNWHIGLILGIIAVYIFTYNYYDYNNEDICVLEFN